MSVQEKAPGAAVTNYIYTYSGNRVDLDGEGAPTIKDVAVHLGRIPRFAGATKGWWTVLHHSICAERIVRAYLMEHDLPSHDTARCRLEALYHDAHESLTGDVPAPFKGEEMKSFQTRFDRRIWEDTLGLEWKPKPAIVGWADRALLATEGRILGPPCGKDNWWKKFDDIPFLELAETTVRNIRFLYSKAEDTIEPGGAAIDAFIELTNTLLFDINHG